MRADVAWLRRCVPCLFLVALLQSAVAAAESSFHQQFMEAKSKTNGFLRDIALVDKNNLGPTLTNVSIPFAKFAQEGELAGIKLGMTMSEVTAAWGRPRSLFTHCVFGPRFWYCTGGESTFGVQGGISLSFRDDRLVLIAVYGDLVQRLTFDNGLTGRMSRAECEKLLGPPDVRDPERRGSLYVGEIAYRAGLIRTDLTFNTWQQRGSVRAPERLDAITVRLEQEARRELTGASAKSQERLVATDQAIVPKVAIPDLLARKEEYKGRRVEVAGYYSGYFEHYSLYESLADRALTNSLWIDPFRDQPGYWQNIGGERADFRGNVRIIGTFGYRPGYGCGHLGGWPAQITNLELFEKIE